MMGLAATCDRCHDPLTGTGHLCPPCVEAAVDRVDAELCEGSCGEPVDGTYCEHDRWLCGACLYLCRFCMDEMADQHAYDDDRDEGF